METKTASQVLQETRTLLLRDGWCQRSYHEGAARCLVGALFTVSPPLRNSAEVVMPTAPAVIALLQALPGGGISMGRSICHLMDFNDHQAEDVRDVIALIDRALVKVTK